MLFQSATLAHINNTYNCTNVQQYNTISTSLARQWAFCSKIASTTIPDTHYHPKSVLGSAVPFVKSLELRICSRKHLNPWLNHQIKVKQLQNQSQSQSYIPSVQYNQNSRFNCQLHTQNTLTLRTKKLVQVHPQIDSIDFLVELHSKMQPSTTNE